MSQKAAVVLCGSGYLDGSEIHEATLCLLHLSMQGVVYTCFAPKIDQTDTMNHALQEPMDQKRSAYEESARISRSEITPLSDLDPKAFDLLVIPGGFGVAKTLCDFASKGKLCSVNQTIEKHILSFIDQKKPIVATCISPALLAKVLERKGLKAKLTLGPDTEHQKILEEMGMEGVIQNASEHTEDSTLKIYTTAAYMDPKTDLKSLNQGIGSAIKSAL